MYPDRTDEAPDLTESAPSIALEEEVADSNPTGTSGDAADNARSLDSNSLGDRYPELRNRVSVDGLSLEGVDLEMIEPKLIGKFVMQNNVVAREIERGILEQIPDLESATMSASKARELYEQNPGTYLARLPVDMRIAPGQDAYVDITPLLPASLYESRALSIELATHPRYEEHLLDYANSSAARTFKNANGEEEYYPLGVVRWERERFGQHLIGYDAEGNVASKIVSVWSGVPH